MDPKTILRVGDRVRIITKEEAVEAGYYRDYPYNDFQFPEADFDSGGNPYYMHASVEEIEKYGGREAVVRTADRYAGEYHWHYSVYIEGERVMLGFCPTMLSGFWEDEPEIEERDDDIFAGLFGGGTA